MSQKNWIPPVELDIAQKEAEHKAEPASPSVLAEEGEPEFATYLSKGQRLDELGEPISADDQAKTLKRQVTWKRRRAFKWLLGSTLLLFAGLMVLDVIAFLEDIFERSLILGTLFASVIGLVLAMLFMLVREEIRDIRRLHDISHSQKEAQRLLQAGGYGGANALTTHIAALYRDRPDIEPGLKAFRTAISDAHSDAEMLRLFGEQVLQPLDKRCYQVVARSSSQTALMIAISPLALLDVMLSLWRSVGMVREIAALYGGRPGPAGTFALMRGVLVNLAAAGVSDAVADAGADALGGSLVAAVSARAGQGIAMGLLTARVGLAAMRLCRPIPFRGEEQPRFSRIRSEVVKAVRKAAAGAAAR